MVQQKAGRALCCHPSSPRLLWQQLLQGGNLHTGLLIRLNAHLLPQLAVLLVHVFADLAPAQWTGIATCNSGAGQDTLLKIPNHPLAMLMPDPCPCITAARTFRSVSGLCCMQQLHGKDPMEQCCTIRQMWWDSQGDTIISWYVHQERPTRWT